MSSAGAFLFVSCVDFLIGTLLLLGVGLQSTYLPHTLSGCNDASDLGLAAPGNTTNLFRFVGQLDNDTPQDECQAYMTTWIMGIVLGYDEQSEPSLYLILRNHQFDFAAQQLLSPQRGEKSTSGAIWTPISWHRRGWLVHWSCPSIPEHSC